MSEANDSKDLDKYGVWVKDAPKDIKGEDLPENALDDIDLPSDDDMFNDIEFPMTAEDLKTDGGAADEGETEISDLDIDLDISGGDENADTTLSPDELSNITGEIDGGSDENADTTLSPDELSNITVAMEEGADENADTTLSPDELLNITGDQEIKAEDAAPADDGMDDFNIDGLDITADEPAAEEAPVQESEPAPEAASEEINLDDIPDGEIDLDDFMSDSSSGGSDSVASAPDGEVDLSAFMDGDDGDVDLSAFMDDAPAAKKEPKPEEIQDEKSLDIDVSFDDSADQIAQEDTSDEPESSATEKLDLPSEDMFDSFGEDGADKAKKSASAAPGDTEEIDLSDFGFDDDDANIGMTAGPGGEEAKKEVVDYDMKVSADDDSKTPSVQDVVMGNIASSDETEIEEGAAVEQTAGAASSGESGLEINEKGKEILSQIMGELSSLKDEIRNLKDDFAELKDRPTPAAESASIPAAATTEAPKDDDNTGFFGASDDEDDTIALSGNELTNILSSAEFSTEDASAEPAVEESSEPEFEETSIGDEDITMQVNDSDMEEPTIDTSEITPEDLAGTTDEFGEENVLPEEISVPKIDDDITVESSSSDLMDSVVNTDEAQVDFEEPSETLNVEAIDEIMQDDVSIADSLDDEKIGYMQQDTGLDESGAQDDVVSVDDIVKENVSLQEDNDDVSIGIGSDIDAAFEEADATEAGIEDSALAEKNAYETSVSDIMKENISLQEDNDDVSVGVGSDIDAAFEEADATESDIVDDALAEKDAYENQKSLEEEFSLDDTPSDDEIPETLDPSVLAAPSEQGSSGDEIDMSIFDEPSIDDAGAEETSVPEPTVAEESPAEPALDETVAAPAAPASKLDTTTISKDLKTEIVSVLSYMDQLLENLPEDKITEFAKSEHFVTYKKLFDELGLS